MIPSFTINHKKLLPGLYVSRRDEVGAEALTTFDMRVCKPNKECLTPAIAHTIEHLMADFLRNKSPLQDDVVYFGPMGCLTGFYLILKGYWMSELVLPHIVRAVKACSLSTSIPGATEEQCGNYKLNDLDGALSALRNYLAILQSVTTEMLCYPE